MTLAGCFEENKRRRGVRVFKKDCSRQFHEILFVLVFPRRQRFMIVLGFGTIQKRRLIHLDSPCVFCIVIFQLLCTVDCGVAAVVAPYVRYSQGCRLTIHDDDDDDCRENDQMSPFRIVNVPHSLTPC